MAGLPRTLSHSLFIHNERDIIETRSNERSKNWDAAPALIQFRNVRIKELPE